MPQKNKLILLLFLFVNQIFGQKLEILTDSIYAESMYFKISELKIHSNSKHIFDIYKIIQDSSTVFAKPYIGLPEERLKVKIDTLKYYFQNYESNEINCTFENYEIYLSKNDIINFSIKETAYHSPWESWEYYLMDLVTGRRITTNLFIDSKTILKKCKSKLKSDGFNWQITVKDLKNYEFTKDENDKVSGIDIIFFDPTYTNHGYNIISTHFNWKEIEKYISPNFKKRLK